MEGQKLVHNNHDPHHFKHFIYALVLFSITSNWCPWWILKTEALRKWLIWSNGWFWLINSMLVQIALALIIILLPLPPMMRRMPARVKRGVLYISCRLHTTATPASPSLINPVVCTSHTASDWSLTDEESAGEKSDLDNRGRETWSLTHVYRLHVSVLKYGYKGVFVKARAAPIRHLASGCMRAQTLPRTNQLKKVQFQY